MEKDNYDHMTRDELVLYVKKLEKLASNNNNI